MPRKYKRKIPDRSVVTEEQLNTAKLLISKGLSKRSVASQIGLNESTLRNRLKIGKTAEKMGYVTFTKAQEDDIFKYLKECENLFYGLTTSHLKKLIYEYAEINKIRHRFNTSKKEAGRDCVYGFLKRFPELKLHIKIAPSAAKTVEINKSQITLFYENLKCLYNKYHFEPGRIYNLGERSIIIAPKVSPKIISMKENNLAGKTNSTEIGHTITLVCAMSVFGNFFPPAFIFPEILKGNLLKNTPKGSIGMVSDSGFSNSDLFMEYLHHFREHVKAMKDNPVLLILDSSHIFLEAVIFCRDNGIHLITLPPYSSEDKQPLNRGLFLPLETKFLSECEEWLNQHPGLDIGETEITNLVNVAFKMVATKNNASTGFKVTGIWPIDNDISPDEDLKASFETDVTKSLKTEKTTSSITDDNLTAPDVSSTSKATDPLSSIESLQKATSYN